MIHPGCRKECCDPMIKIKNENEMRQHRRKKVHDTAKELVRAWQIRMLKLIEMQRPQDFVKNIPASQSLGTINFAPPPKPSQPIRPPDRIIQLMQPRSLTNLHKPPMPKKVDPPKPSLLLENFHSRAFKTNTDHSRNQDSLLPRNTSKNTSMGEKSSKNGNSGFGIDISLIPNANDSSLEKSTINRNMFNQQSNHQKHHVKNLMSSKSLISTINKRQGQSPPQGQHPNIPKTPAVNPFQAPMQSSEGVAYETARYKYINSNLPQEYMTLPIKTHSPIRSSGTLLVPNE